MSDIGYDIFAVIDHPVIAPHDGITWVYALDTFRDDSFLALSVIFRHSVIISYVSTPRFSAVGLLCLV